jgi:hypothetical protein
MYITTMLTSLLAGHSQLGRRAEVASPPIRHGYFAYPRQRFQGLAGFRRPSSLHHRKVRRGDATPQVAHVLQPSRSAALQELRRAYAEAHVGRRGDGWFRTGVERVVLRDSIRSLEQRRREEGLRGVCASCVIVVVLTGCRGGHSFACTYVPGFRC